MAAEPFSGLQGIGSVGRRSGTESPPARLHPPCDSLHILDRLAFSVLLPIWADSRPFLVGILLERAESAKSTEARRQSTRRTPLALPRSQGCDNEPRLIGPEGRINNRSLL